MCRTAALCRVILARELLTRPAKHGAARAVRGEIKMKNVYLIPLALMCFAGCDDKADTKAKSAESEPVAKQAEPVTDKEAKAEVKEEAAEPEAEEAEAAEPAGEADEGADENLDE